MLFGKKPLIKFAVKFSFFVDEVLKKLTFTQSTSIGKDTARGMRFEEVTWDHVWRKRQIFFVSGAIFRWPFSLPLNRARSYVYTPHYFPHPPTSRKMAELLTAMVCRRTSKKMPQASNFVACTEQYWTTKEGSPTLEGLGSKTNKIFMQLSLHNNVLFFYFSAKYHVLTYLQVRICFFHNWRTSW